MIILFRYVLLDCIYKINGERSTASIFHLLKGKRSSQTIQDTKIYHLTNYFGILKQLERYRFEEAIRVHCKAGLITMEVNQHAKITREGLDYLEANTYLHALNRLKGMDISGMVDTFWLRLQLTIQTYSNLANNNYQFIPITSNQDIQRWIKNHYKQYRSNKKTWLQAVYQELLNFLEQLPSLYARIFVHRLSGHNKIGLSINQLARKEDLHPIDVQIILTSILHDFIYQIRTKSLHSPYVEEVIPYEQQQSNFITESAKKTNQWLMKGFSLEQIAKIRKLKASTIEDHVIEIAYMNPEFSIEQFIAPHAYQSIHAVIAQTKTKKLKQIKAILGDQYSYFEIRLVLSYLNDK